MTQVLTVNNPTASNPLDGNAQATPEPVGTAIPAGATSVTLTNRGAASALFELGVSSGQPAVFVLTTGSATTLAAGASATVSVGSNNFLSVQGVNLTLDVAFN